MGNNIVNVTKNGTMVLAGALAVVFTMIALANFGIIDLTKHIVAVLTISAALFLLADLGGLAALGSSKPLVIGQAVLAFVALLFGVLGLFGIVVEAVAAIAGIVATIVVVLAVV